MRTAILPASYTIVEKAATVPGSWERMIAWPCILRKKDCWRKTNYIMLKDDGPILYVFFRLGSLPALHYGG
jgi:hypothetical protein